MITTSQLMLVMIANGMYGVILAGYEKIPTWFILLTGIPTSFLFLWMVGHEI